ncbi:tyrosine-type recombinase/integrase [Roseomonas terrae]|uniref:Tyrosine-type recombinase/integrase n=1 Tax=Neoroseomonas terrae TaxID=424799 RepID=A0ABS5EQS9_9PROT|nr:tyrosine-type recombinase/integrase [Neoroseomonas terrae]MBR0653376.1 tyrosine-type recombinase/integrase [Neoroseomonas terrae]
MSKREPMRGARSILSTRQRYVWEVVGAGGQRYLYYRRGSHRIPLRGPEGSTAFIEDYNRADALFEGAPRRAKHSVDEAITAYLGSSDFKELQSSTQSDYRRTLDLFRESFGPLQVVALDEAWLERLRDRYAGAPITWNHLRSRMIMVMRKYRKLHPGLLPANFWESTERLRAAKSRMHRRWPTEVLIAVLRAATPEFRCLIIGYLLTAQRGSDVTKFSPAQWDAAAATLDIRQQKTDEPQLIHVPPSLARAFTAMAGRHPLRLFVTPRGKAWTTGNAQETLARLVAQLDLDHYTLHGLRKTGPSALKMLGFENRAIRSLTGHTSDKNLELYLDGVQHLPLAKAAQEALEQTFGDIIAAAEDGGNERRFSGITGRAARKANAVNSVKTGKQADGSEEPET